MGQDGRDSVQTITGWDGSPITKADLPAPNTKRWVARRKAEVVIAVNRGLLTFEEAQQRYSLSIEEFQEWENALYTRAFSNARPHRIGHSHVN